MKSPEYSLENNQKCNICYIFFSVKSLPFVLNCGHTICNICVVSIYNKEDRVVRCPFDKKYFTYDSVNSIPVNFSYLNILKSLEKLGINQNCKFFENENFSKFCLEELKKCRTIIDLGFMKDHPHLKECKKLIYEKVIPSLNHSTIYDKFKENKKIISVKTFMYEDGNFFEGSSQYGKKNGWGRKKNSKDTYYEGFYENNLKEGYGIEISKTGDVYIGTFSNNMKNGQGVLFYNKPNYKYEGHFFNNKKHGEAREVYHDMVEYIGNFCHGGKTGKGVFNWPNGNFLDGEFFNGKLEGDGKEKTSTYRYKGNFKNGLKNGYGIIVYENGSMFKGEFIEGMMQGKGVVKYTNGMSYSGDFYQNKKSGKGELDIIDKSLGRNNKLLTYKGDFLNDHFDGEGTLTNKYGDVYRGGFKYGMKSGYGVLMSSNGDE